MNRTLLLALVSSCRKAVLEDLSPSGSPANGSGDHGRTATPSKPYDNAYFYILVVMFFYSFLAITLFRSFVDHDKSKKESNEEFVPAGASQDKFSSTLVEKFDFDEGDSP